VTGEKCPECGNETMTTALDLPYCPRCGWAGSRPLA